MTGPATAAVLIATYNRAARLAETLDVLAASRTDPAFPWEVVVVDNNSTDGTREVVTGRQAAYPVPLRYLFEVRQGRSAALNRAIAATAAPYLLFTDDDVRVHPDWVAAGARALAGGADYAGGPVLPIWESPPPPWLDLSRGDLWGTIAICDYGTQPFAFEDRRKVPLGANMGLRRSLIERVGPFRVDLGRTSGRRVLGQEVPELLARARAAGLRGTYVPGMTVSHHVPTSRLTKQYFRRWWHGRGYCRAIVEAAQPVTEEGLDLRTVPHIGPVPRFIVSDAVRDALAYVLAALAGDLHEQSRREMRLAQALGYVSARGFARRPAYPPPGPGDQPESTRPRLAVPNACR